jgi:hypothetical protein
VTTPHADRDRSEQPIPAEYRVHRSGTPSADRAARVEAMLRGANDDWRTAVAERDKLARALAKVRELIEGTGGLLPDAIRVILAEIEEPEPIWASRELPEGDAQ